MEQAGGNTGTPARKPSKSRNWFFTLNNPMEASIGSTQMEQLLLMLDPKAYIFQLEKGEEGTPHFQGCVAVRNPIVMPKHLSKKIHWEYCKSWAAAAIYCSKDEGRLEGPWSLGYEVRKPLKVITELRPWQAAIKSIIDEEPDERTIYWFWEPDGNTGKTAFAKWMCKHYDALYLSGKATDIKYAVSMFVKRAELKTVVFDYCRTSEGFVSYEALEAVKNGIFFSGKYEGGMVMFNSPHVIVFANWPPDQSKLSADRWYVERIDEITQ